MTPEQAARAAAEADPAPAYPDGRPKYHRHFADYAVHRDAECANPYSRRRVYVFDPEDLTRHESFLKERTHAEVQTRVEEIRRALE